MFQAPGMEDMRGPTLWEMHGSSRGYGLPAAGSGGYLNDLWKYNLASGQWTWMTGASTIQPEGNVRN